MEIDKRQDAQLTSSKENKSSSRSKNIYVIAGIILMVLLIGGGVVLSRQERKNKTGGAQNSDIPRSTLSPAPLQLRYFDMNEIPLTLDNSEAVFNQNDQEISDSLIST